MYLQTKPGIMKIASILLLVIVTGVGISARNKSKIKDALDDPDIYALCSLLEDCPHETKAMETAFVYLTIVFLVLSIANLVLTTFFLDTKEQLNSLDIGFVTVTGVVVLVCGAMMIYSAVRIDEFLSMDNLSFIPGYGTFKGNIRKETKYVEKLVAGVLGIIDAILFFSTVTAIRGYGNPPAPQTIIIQQQAPTPYYPGQPAQIAQGVPNYGYTPQQSPPPTQGYGENQNQQYQINMAEQNQMNMNRFGAPRAKQY